MLRVDTEIADLVLVETGVQADARGFLAELYNARDAARLGIKNPFVQDNFSSSPRRWTVRGLHFQTPPHVQAKLVRVLRGAAFTVALDLRLGSPWFGRHFGVELSARNWRMLYVPRGFAHGVLTLEPDTEVFYKLDAHHVPEHARGVAWNDPELGIAWPVSEGEAIVSERDRAQPRLRELPPLFHYCAASEGEQFEAIAGRRIARNSCDAFS